MRIKKTLGDLFVTATICFISFFFPLTSFSQQEDSLKPKYIYNPNRLSNSSNETAVDDTLPVPDSSILLVPTLQQIQDSLALKDQYIRDSLLKREQFVKDSILAREQFVKDSILRRQRMLDSLTFLRQRLPNLLNAYFRTVKEDIILKNYDISIVGDSALGEYTYLVVPFSANDPYVPWKASYPLSGPTVRFSLDQQKQKIVTLRTPNIRCNLTYGKQNNLLILHEQAEVQNNWAGKFFKEPVDSVFFDPSGRIAKIKRYVLYYSLKNSNQKGSFLFQNLEQVKQYEYTAGGRVAQYQFVKFCDRRNAGEPNKVCSMITYTFTGSQNEYEIIRSNDPVNKYSDGTFRMTFDNQDNLETISFRNVAGTENWERMVEMNDLGYVHCYMDKIKGVVHQSLCMIYHTDASGGKTTVERITTLFEEDGISYYQKNNTTGKVRTRNRLTLEWSPWR